MGKQSHVFSLKMQVFQFLRTCGMCYIHFTVASEACMNIFFVYTWLERLQKSIKGKLFKAEFPIQSYFNYRNKDFYQLIFF